MFGNRKLISLVSLLVVVITILSACAPATPQVIEKEVVVEKPVVQTVVVEKEVVVEKPVVETVVVEKPVEVVVTATPSPVEGPLCGGTIVCVITSDPSHLNVGIGPISAVRIPANPMFEGLVRMTASMEWEPELAESWEISEDRTEFRFDLVRDARWHDGTPFTCADVKFTFEEVLKPVREPAIWGVLEGVECPDPYTAVIRLSQSMGILSSGSIYWTEYGAPIIPKHLYEGTDIMTNEYNLKPVGTGAFKFKEWARGSHIILERNEDYRDPTLPYLDRVVFKIIPDPSAQVAAFEAGELDYAVIFAKDQLPLVEGIPGVEAAVVPLVTGGIQRLILSCAHPILSNKMVRQALSYAVDREAMVKIAANNLGTVLSKPFDSGSPHLKWASDPDLKGYTYDPERANGLLDEAGYPRGEDGIRFQVSLDVDRGNSEYVAVAELARDMFKDVGVDLQLNMVDHGTLLSRLFNWEYEMTLVYIVQGPDPDRNRFSYHSESLKKGGFGGLGMQYHNPRVDELLDLGSSTVDREERARIYHELERILVEDAPNIWLYEHLWVFPYRTDFEGPAGYYPPTITKFEDPTRTWWKKGSPCEQ